MSFLILGGTSEASRLAAALASLGQVRATLSLAGRTTAPAASPLPHRIGGFGGVEGLVAYLQSEAVCGVIDATHPFAARMSDNAVAACARTEVPLLAFTRPPWRAQDGDAWTEVANIAAAVAHLAKMPSRRVFLTTGRLELAAFRAAPQHRYLARSIDPPGDGEAPARATIVLGRGPFAVADEVALMRRENVDLVVSKNSGGAASAGKLAAARQLGLPVLMVARPAIAHRPITQHLDDVLAWIAHHALPR